MASFLNGVRFKPASAGTADFVVASAAQGYQTPANANATNGATYRYRAESKDLLEWEIGYGIYTSATATLARTTILFSSNSNSKVSFTRVPEVGIVFLKEDADALQSLDATLTALAGLDSSAGFVTQTGADAFTKTAIGTGVDTFITTPSSANLRAALTDETGTGAAVFATSPTLVTPALGTPSAIVLTNATGLPVATGISGLGTGVAAFLATPSSANLASAVTDETGSGALVFGTSPTFTTDITVPNTGLHILDTNASHDLIVKPGSDLTADRTLTVTTGDADRTLDISAGSVTITAAGAAMTGAASAAAQTALLSNVVGDSGSGGTKGLVPAPSAGDAAANKFLHANGTFAVVPVGGISGFGTGVLTALQVNTGSAGAFVVNGGALGTPSSGTLTNATNLPVATGVSGLGAGVATFLATPSSANLASAVTDETGSGALVFATSPTLVTPALGTPSSGTLTNCTGLSVAGGGTGLASATAYAVLCGGTTSTGAFQSIAGVGTSGQILTSNGAGALPTFQAAPGGGTAATQAEMEAASSTAVFVSPGRTQYHPGVSKAWARITYSGGTPSASESHNVTSVTDTGTGDARCNLTTAFAAATFGAVASSHNTTGYANAFQQSASVIESFFVNRSDGALSDNPSSVAGFGDQ